MPLDVIRHEGKALVLANLRRVGPTVSVGQDDKLGAGPRRALISREPRVERHRPHDPAKFVLVSVRDQVPIPLVQDGPERLNW